jgi:hypothetical protein
MRWLVQARNTVEKQGDLDTASVALVSVLLTDGERLVHRMEVPPLGRRRRRRRSGFRCRAPCLPWLEVQLAVGHDPRLMAAARGTETTDISGLNLPRWWVVVLVGALAIAAGILALVWPGPTLLLIGLLRHLADRRWRREPSDRVRGRRRHPDNRAQGRPACCARAS